MRLDRSSSTTRSGYRIMVSWRFIYRVRSFATLYSSLLLRYYCHTSARCVVWTGCRAWTSERTIYVLWCIHVYNGSLTQIRAILYIIIRRVLARSQLLSEHSSMDLAKACAAILSRGRASFVVGPRFVGFIIMHTKTARLRIFDDGFIRL